MTNGSKTAVVEAGARAGHTESKRMPSQATASVEANERSLLRCRGVGLLSAFEVRLRKGEIW